MVVVVEVNRVLQVLILVVERVGLVLGQGVVDDVDVLVVVVLLLVVIMVLMVFVVEDGI